MQQQHEVPTLTADIPELPTRCTYTPDAPDYHDLTFSPEDDAKLDRAAKLGKSLIERARAGDQQALADLQHKMHLTVYQIMR